MEFGDFGWNFQFVFNLFCVLLLSCVCSSTLLRPYYEVTTDNISMQICVPYMYRPGHPCGINLCTFTAEYHLRCVHGIVTDSSVCYTNVHVNACMLCTHTYVRVPEDLCLVVVVLQVCPACQHHPSVGPDTCSTAHVHPVQKMHALTYAWYTLQYMYMDSGLFPPLSHIRTCVHTCIHVLQSSVKFICN